uniref:AAA_12 domain-containing protein n=1 Tax=Caenorhabditis japonica TaxID=281687 RepID=A0A8R1I968_CAEJA
AVTAAVARLRKLDKKKECCAVRLITAKNWMTIEHEHRTHIDFPIKWTECFLEVMSKANNGQQVVTQDVVSAAIYLIRARKILRTAADGKLHMRLLPLFLRIYQPALILGTCTSVRSMFSTPGMDTFATEVELLLMDEASQLPRFALIGMAHKFPRARPALLGDIGQLPPYQDQEMPPMLGQWTVGNILNDATAFERFSLLPLLQAHRRPSDITDMLSTMFYDNQLESAPSPPRNLPELANLRLPSRYSLLVCHHDFRFQQEGTTLVNEGEASKAVQYAMALHQLRTDASIAILCFSRGQTELVARRVKRYATVLSVDSAQGREFDYIIILATRTSGSFTFIDDPRRVNLAISRTKR